jgi:PIN domain nuclease of toxin-antitoxin system
LNALLDTHALIWWMEQSERLSPTAAKIIENQDNVILISAAVGWELAIKVATGKVWPRSILNGLDLVLERESFTELAITIEMATRAGLLPPHHRDPFDRMLVAQSQILGVPLISGDAVLDSYEIERIW